MTGGCESEEKSHKPLFALCGNAWVVSGTIQPVGAVASCLPAVLG